MKIDILTIFPEMFSALDASILGRAQENHHIEIAVYNIRDYSLCKHKNTDDYPFGGGAGMLMTPQPIADAIEDIAPSPFRGKRIYMSPRGQTLTQQMVRDLAKEENLLLLCGHYEGVDERVIDEYIDLEISIGDYVLTGGELPAMVLVDAVSRMLEGVLGSEESAEDESFSADGLLEYPQYTRPRCFHGREVPEVLLNGNHKEIGLWRRKEAIMTTLKRRPEMLETASLTDKERAFIEQMTGKGDREE